MKPTTPCTPRTRRLALPLLLTLSLTLLGLHAPLVAQAQRPEPPPPAEHTHTHTHTHPHPAGEPSDALAQCLPDAALVQAQLRASPLMRAAAAQKQSLDARARGLQAGQAEFNLKANLQRRSVSEGGGRFTESALGLERPWRSAAKREGDMQLARQTEAQARIEYADALHEAGRELLKTWLQALRAQASVRNAQAGLALAKTLQQQVAARQRQGEAAQLDADLAQAELQRAQSLLQTAQGQLQAQHALLQQRYPGLPRPQDGPPPVLPQLLERPGEQAAQRAEFLQKSHELNALRAQAQRLQGLARRADLERQPDPVLGVFLARERGGAENLAGLTLSLPLGGAARSAQSDQAWAEATAADARVQVATEQLAAAFDAQWLRALHQRAAAEQLQQAAQHQSQALAKARKGHALGEGSMAELAPVMRNAIDMQQAAEQLQWDAAEALLLLRLDLHQLWDFDD